jgi:hypothetical protein
MLLQRIYVDGNNKTHFGLHVIFHLLLSDINQICGCPTDLSDINQIWGCPTDLSDINQIWGCPTDLHRNQ